MTTAADDRALEQAFEAGLAGRPVPEEAASLAAFTRAVRSSSDRPGRPNAALAELLATGLLTDLPSPSDRTARTTGKSPSRARTPLTNRRRLAMFLPLLITKFLSAGAVAQAATGAGVAVVIVTGAGAVGVLPGPAQDTFAVVTGVEAEESEVVDPAPLDDPAEAPVETPVEAVPEVPAEDVPVVVPDDETEPVDDVDAAPEPVEDEAEGLEDDDDLLAEPFGRSVSADARDGGVNGQEISERAKQRNEQRRAEKAAQRAAGEHDDDDEKKSKKNEKSKKAERDDSDDDERDDD